VLGAVLFATGCFGIGNANDVPAGRGVHLQRDQQLQQSCRGRLFICDGIGTASHRLRGRWLRLTCEGTGAASSRAAAARDQFCDSTGSCICEVGCSLPDAGYDAGPG
jgi:hypothetical protein